MKKIIFFISLCLLPLGVCAQSTCETRVDAHQRASTKQRVRYCLTPQVQENTATDTGLVFSGVSTRRVAQTQPSRVRPTARNTHFDSSKVAVSTNFVDTGRFPQLTQQGAYYVQTRTVKTPTRLTAAQLRQQLKAQAEQAAQQAVEQTGCNAQGDCFQEGFEVAQPVASSYTRMEKPARQQFALSPALQMEIMDKETIFPTEKTMDFVLENKASQNQHTVN